MILLHSWHARSTILWLTAQDSGQTERATGVASLKQCVIVQWDAENSICPAASNSRSRSWMMVGLETENGVVWKFARWNTMPAHITIVQYLVGANRTSTAILLMMIHEPRDIAKMVHAGEPRAGAISTCDPQQQAIPVVLLWIQALLRRPMTSKWCLTTPQGLIRPSCLVGPRQ